MFRSDLLCYVACTSVAVASAFTPSAVVGPRAGLLPGARHGVVNFHSVHARGASKRALGLRMQQEGAEITGGLAVEEKPEAAVPEPVKTVKAVENKIGVAIRTRGDTKVQTETEVNFYARTASRLGFLKQTSPLLTTQMVGNKGFDPLNLAKKNDLLLQYREAELKHARLAMLASVGWAVSELVHPNLAKITGSQSLLQPGATGLLEKAPSVLNGGLSEVNPALWVVLGLITSILEAWRMVAVAENPKAFTPGDLGFDPLEIYKVADEQERRSLLLKEINNGRLAMVAIAVFAAQEFLGNSAVVNMFPQFFTAGPLANIGSVGDLIFQYTGLLSCQSGLVYCSEGQGAMEAFMQQDNGASAEYMMEVLGK